VKAEEPKYRPLVGKEEMALCRSEEGEPCDGSDQNILFQVAVSFL